MLDRGLSTTHSMYFPQGPFAMSMQLFLNKFSKSLVMQFSLQRRERYVTGDSIMMEQPVCFKCRAVLARLDAPGADGSDGLKSSDRVIADRSFSFKSSHLLLRNITPANLEYLASFNSAVRYVHAEPFMNERAVRELRTGLMYTETEHQLWLSVAV